MGTGAMPAGARLRQAMCRNMKKGWQVVHYVRATTRLFIVKSGGEDKIDSGMGGKSETI